MSIQTDTNKSGPYACNGVTVDFPITIPVAQESDIQVVQTTISSGLDTVVTTGITIDIDAKNVKFDVAPSALYEVTLLLATPITQPDDFESYGGIQADEVEGALDRLTRQNLKQEEELERCVKVGVTADDPDELLEAISQAVEDSQTAQAGAEAAEANAVIAQTGAETAETAAEAAETASGDYEALCAQAVIDAEAAAGQAIAAAGSVAPVGTIFAYPVVTAPSGFLLCDGSAVSRTTYSELFDLMGEDFGVGDGSTTFNLPNIKGKTVIGLDAAQAEFDAMGETGGAKTHTLILSEIPAHTHPNVQRSGSTWSSGETAGVIGSSGSTGSAGGGDAHNNLQPYIVLQYIIKAENALQPDVVKATQAQAEAGTDNDTYMTPLRTAEAIDALGGGDVYVDRGDPSAWDFEAGDLTLSNSAFQDLDLSSIVPAGATRVLLSIQVRTDTVQVAAEVRENGNSSAYNTLTTSTIVTGVTSQVQGGVVLDSNRIVEYRIGTAATVVKILVRGWWI